MNSDWVSDMISEGKKCLIGKALTRKMVKLQAMKIVFSRIWMIKGSFRIREVGEKSFLFQFDDWIDNEMVMQN